MSTEIAEFLEDGPAAEEEPEVQLDDPLDMRPDLTLLGIEEIERGVCEDTYENRATIRRAKLRYQALYDQNGRGTGLIHVFTVDALIERRIISLGEKRPLMVDPTNRDSDYLTGLDLLLDEAACAITPPWVVNATKRWQAQQVAGGPTYSHQAKPLPKRCRMIKSDTIRCMLWSSGMPKDDGLCRIHVKSQRKPSDDIARARKKLVQSAPYAVDTLEELMDSAESEPVRLKASTEILDRAGIRGGQDFTVDIEVTDTRTASQVVMERLGRLAAGAQAVQERLDRDGEIEDAEIVDPALESSPGGEIATTSASGGGPAEQLLLALVARDANNSSISSEFDEHELETDAQS